MPKGNLTHATQQIGGVIADIYHADSRSIPMSIFATSVIAGTSIAPTIFSLIAVHWGWRWTNWFQLIINMVGFCILWFGLKETRGNVLLRQKATALNAWLDEQEKYAKEMQVGERRGVRWKVKADEAKQSLWSMIKVSLTRPFRRFPYFLDKNGLGVDGGLQTCCSQSRSCSGLVCGRHLHGGCFICE